MSAKATCRVSGRIGSVRVSGLTGQHQPQAAPAQLDPSAEAAAVSMRHQLQAELSALEQAGRALASGAAQLAELEGVLVHQAEEKVLELALEIAAKVLMQEVRAGRHEVAPIVEEALQRVPTRRDVVVRLHPEDLARCQAAGEGSDPAEGFEIRFVADPTVPRAGCIVETPEGVIESTLEGHLERLGEALRAPE